MTEPLRHRLGALLEVAWLALLILPAATSGSESRIFDANEYGVFIAACWLVLAGRLL